LRPTRFAYVPALDGLRGLLVFPVALFHFSITAGWDPVRVYAPGSFFAPSTFFALSGYLITSLLLAEEERTGGIDGRGFWSRRFRRLLPSSLLVIVACSVLTAFFPDLWGPLPGSDVAAPLASVANWQEIHLAGAGECLTAAPDMPTCLRLLGPLGIFWSLSLEEQFYLGLFAVVALAVSRGRDMTRWLVGMLVVVGVASVASLAVVQSTPQREYFGTDTRASELVAGCLLAVWVHHHGLPRHRAWRWLGWIALAVAVACWAFVREDDPWVLGGGLAAFSLVNVGLIVGAASAGSMSRMMSWRPLVALGRLSYPVYLIHWPIALIMQPDRLHLVGWPLMLARFAVSVALAWMVLRFVERPLRTSKLVEWPWGLVVWGLPAIGAVVLAVAVSGWGWPG
jgi:peptidoglycan/LPS O-acetylase OafA/YrhL